MVEDMALGKKKRRKRVRKASRFAVAAALVASFAGSLFGCRRYDVTGGDVMIEDWMMVPDSTVQLDPAPLPAPMPSDTLRLPVVPAPDRAAPR